jgi:bacterioferritin (cytochrome b1)
MSTTKRQILDTNVLNESLYEDILERDNTENIRVEVWNSKEILERKQKALEQALDILESVVDYQELQQEKNFLKRCLEDTEGDIEILEEDLKQLEGIKC